MSFLPWWSRGNNRTICFVAESMNDEIYFYADVDEYPLNFATYLLDNNGIIVVESSSPFYAKKVETGVFGTYFIRVRRQY